MLGRFTEPARQVVVLAQDEARGLTHGYLGTEHLLLGLVREDRGAAARVLASAGVEQDAVRARATTGVAAELKAGQIPFSQNARKVLEQSLREALRRDHGFIGTEHILLGLVTVPDSTAARILSGIGADAGSIRAELLLMIGSL